MRSRTGKTWFQIAAVLFFLNTATAYGACCFVLPDTGSGVEMPCHETEDGAGDEMSDDCCLLCLPILQVEIGSKVIVDVHQTNLIAKNDLPVTSGVDPPFRPPIQLLS